MSVIVCSVSWSLLTLICYSMYLLGGYVYTPPAICEFFAGRGLTLERPGIGLQATRFLKQQGQPYLIRSCMYNNEHMFMFVAAYKLMLDETTTYHFEETEAARAMKEELKLEGAAFVTAIY